MLHLLYLLLVRDMGRICSDVNVISLTSKKKVVFTIIEAKILLIRTIHNL